MLDEFEIIEKCGKLYLKDQDIGPKANNNSGAIFDLLSPPIQVYFFITFFKNEIIIIFI